MKKIETIEQFKFLKLISLTTKISSKNLKELIKNGQISSFHQMRIASESSVESMEVNGNEFQI